MKKIIFLVAAAAACIAMPQWATAQKEITLKFNPADGSRYVYDMNTVQKITQEMMGQKMEIGVNMDMGFLYDITAAGNNKDIKITYEKIATKTMAMGQNMEMSSENPDDKNEGNKMLRALKGATVNVIVTPSGEVVQVNGIKELKEKIGTGSSNARVQETLSNMFNEDVIKSSVEQSFKIYPDKPVKPGDTWTSNTAIKVPFKLTSINTYTLNKVVDGKAYIGIKSKMSTNGKQELQTMGQTMEMVLDGTADGNIIADEATGMTLAATFNQLMDGKVYVMGQEVPMNINSDIKITGAKK